jgi:hypothetical protein
MTFKGIRFRRTRTVVTLPFNPNDTSVTAGYVKFGCVCKPNARGAILTEWQRGSESLYAKPVPISGYSRTNMAYGLDGRTYLYLDGVCYTAPPAKKRHAQATAIEPQPESEDTADLLFEHPPRRGRTSELAERTA